MPLALPSFIPFKLAAIGAAGALLLSVGLGTGLVLTRAKLETVKAQYSEFIEKVNANTAKWESLGLVRLISKQRDQINEANKSLAVSKARSAALDARYDSLWSRYSSGRRSVTVPIPTEDAGRFVVCPSDRGFWCIRPAVGLAILHAGDVAVQRVHDLLDFNAAQASIDVNLPPPDDGVSDGR